MAVWGNLTIDEIESGGEVRVVPGGSALFVSASVSQLGGKVDVVSSIGSDYPAPALSWLRNEGVDVRAVKAGGRFTTRFRISYAGEVRQLTLVNQAEMLDARDLSKGWDAIHLGPVFNEVDLNQVLAARSRCDFLSLDIQGLLRTRDDGGFVRLSPRNLGRVLELCDLLKVSEEEAKTQTCLKDPIEAALRLLDDGPRIVILTRGARGAVLATSQQRVYTIPAFWQNVVDSTGAGDCFLGGWLATYLESSNPVWAACVGSSLSSLVLGTYGFSKFPVSTKELSRRSEWVYERVKALSV